MLLFFFFNLACRSQYRVCCFCGLNWCLSDFVKRRLLEGRLLPWAWGGADTLPTLPDGAEQQSFVLSPWWVTGPSQPHLPAPDLVLVLVSCGLAETEWELMTGHTHRMTDVFVLRINVPCAPCASCS